MADDDTTAHAPDEDAQTPDPATAGRRERRLWLQVVGGLVIVLVLWAGLAAVMARGRLADARASIEATRLALEELDFIAAQSHLEDSRTAFGRAGGWAGAPPLRLAGVLPDLGNNVDAVRAMAAAGETAAGAAIGVLDTINELGGLEAFLPTDGRFPATELGVLVEPALDVITAASEAEAILRGAPRTGLLSDVAEARALFLDELVDARDGLEPFGAFVAALPGFLGADEPRTYFIGATTPSELRGTSGFLGAYAILTLEDGRPSLTGFREIQALENLEPDEIAPPDPEYAARYDRYGGAGFWMNINLTPHGPWAGEAIVNLYAATEGVDLDGVILTNPVVLQALIGLTGPVEGPAGFTLTGDTTVDIVANEAYSVLTQFDERKRLLGQAADAAFGAFLQGRIRADAGTAVNDLLATARAGHLVLYAADDVIQDSFVAMGVAGELPDASGQDLLGVISNSGSATKVDYYVRRRIIDTVRLQDDGSARHEATIRFNNQAPTSGVDDYVIGPRPLSGIEAGQARYVTSVFCKGDCLDRETGIGVGDGGENYEVERGHGVIEFTHDVPAGRRRAIDLTWRARNVWGPTDGQRAAYEVAVRDQAQITPTVLELRVALPPGGEWAFDVERSDPRLDEIETEDGERVLAFTGIPALNDTFMIQLRRVEQAAAQRSGG